MASPRRKRRRLELTGGQRQPLPPDGAPIGVLDARLVGDFPAWSQAARLLGRGKLEEAAAICADLIARYPEPAHPEACYVLALAMWWRNHDGPRAEELLRHVVEARPGVYEYWYNLGFVLQRQEKTEEAVSCYRRCLDMAPRFTGAHVNLGNAYLAEGHLEAAVAEFDIATQCDTRDALAHYNRSIAYMMLGRWEEGWAEYEYRWANPEFLARVARPPLPFWKGEPPTPGKRLLVFAEQGLGDTLMCYRYADKLRDMWGAANVQWIVQEGLASLLNGAPMDFEHWPEADYCVPAMSLPLRCGMPLDGLPYLKPRLLYERPIRRVGYVWAGSTTHELDHRRSIPRDMFEPLLSMSGVEWVEMQVGRGGTYAPVNWEQTARDLSTLDLLITVDTAIAHLAGAMGLETWLLLPSFPDFRWGIQGDTTLWYESVRLYRQPRTGAWREVLDRVRMDLSVRLAE